MSCRSAALLLALVALVPTALAHADPSETAYDPLTLDFHGWLAPAGALVPAPPADGAVYFAAYTPGSAAPPLDFSMLAPSRFAPANGFSVHAHLVADKPVVAEDANGDSFTISLLADGQPVQGASRTIALSPALAPGASGDLDVVLQAPGAVFAEGAKVTLRLAPLMPALADQSLKVTLGAAGSRADFLGAKLPSVADLGLVEPTDAKLFLLANGSFVPPEGNAAALVVLSITQNATRATTPIASSPVTYVELRGDHSVAEGRAYHEFADAASRNAAAQVFRVGSERVRVHPGVAVVVRVNVTPNRVVDVACESGCPAGGWKASLPALSVVAAGGGVAQDPADVLIPPPRATAGIPVSGDAPPAKKAPGFEPVLALAVLALLSRARRP